MEEKYYFRVSGWDGSWCEDNCAIKNVGIGSVSCQTCEHSNGTDKPCKFTGNIDWIKCKRLKEALGELKTPVN